MSEISDNAAELYGRGNSTFWGRTVFGTALAGALYPVAAVLLFLAIAVLLGGAGGFFGPQELVGVFISLLVASVFGFFYAGGVCLVIVLPVMWLARRLLGARRYSFSVAAFTGGMTGWLCSMPFGLSFMAQGEFAMLLLAPGLAILMGQLGAARFTRDAAVVVIDQPAPLRFGMLQLLGLTTLTALIFAVLGVLDRAEVMPIRYSLAVLAIGAVFQAAFLLAGRAITKWRSSAR